MRYTQLQPMRYFLVVDVQRDHSFDDLSDVALWAEIRLSDRGRADVTAYKSFNDMLADKKQKTGAFTARPYCAATLDSTTDDGRT
jgi:hypothetical protein